MVLKLKGEKMKIMFGGGIFGREALCYQGREIIKQLKKHHTVELDAPIQKDGYWESYFGNFKSGEEDVYVMNGHIPYIPIIAKNHKNIIHITQFESKLPPLWVDCLNHPNVKQVWAISEFTKQIILDSGVKKPVEVTYLGLDERFCNCYVNILKEESFKFFNVCAPHCVGFRDRKGLDVLLQAFKEEFGDNTDVTLILKINTIYLNMYHKDLNIYDYLISLLPEGSNLNNIAVITDYYPIEMLNNLYNSIDCGVFPHRGEGFGLPEAELIKIGKPVITTDYSATNEFTNPELRIKVKQMLPLDIDIKNHPYEGQLFAEPDKEHLKLLMREVYINKDNLKVSNKIFLDSKPLKEFEWDKIGLKLNEYLKKAKEE